MIGRSAEDRLARLLALVPWVVAQDGPRIEDVCSRFGIDRGQLVAELNLVWCCGVYPFTPDTLIDVVMADERVWIRYAEYFDRPLRLTPEEGLVLVASGATLMADPGADHGGPLARGLAKVSALLGVEVGATIDVHLDPVAPHLLETLRTGVSENRRVELDYYSFGRDERSVRKVDPYAVFAGDGAWYLAAWCHQAGGPRRFRVDRAHDATLIDEHFPAPREDDVDHATYLPSDADPRVVLDLTPRARWIIDHYPVESVAERRGGKLRVTLAVSERPWLERLLLRLGPDATVVSGDPELVAKAAQRVLARYEKAPDNR